MPHLFRATFHDSGIPQAIEDLDGVIVEANAAFCRLLKYEDLVGTPCSTFVVGGHTDTVGAIEGLKGSRNLLLARKQYRKSDGSLIWVDVYLSGIYEGGRLKYVLGQILDQTIQQELEDSLQSRQDEIEKFAYVAAHDLREPLSNLVGFATLLRKRCGDGLHAQGKKWLEEVIDGAQVMARKVDDLLAFSRAGRNSPRGEFPLGLAVEEAKRMVVRQLRESGGSIDVLGDLPVVRGDRAMVAQIFQNLFSNSLKYRGAEPPKVTVQAEAHEGRWLVKVADNGLGFDAKTYGDRIFEVFQRLYTIDQYPGTGIGLAIAKKIVECHGGSIWSDSTPGQGATFFFTLRGCTKHDSPTHSPDRRRPINSRPDPGISV